MSNRITLPAETDDLTAYIFHNYAYLMTVNELAMWKSISAYVKADGDEGSSLYRMATRNLGIDINERKKIRNDPLPFYIGVRDRIMREHQDRIILNRCPKCSALTRTPKAKLCPKCNHSWHNQPAQPGAGGYSPEDGRKTSA